MASSGKWPDPVRLTSPAGTAERTELPFSALKNRH
jgi:hypothetical protein